MSATLRSMAVSVCAVALMAGCATHAPQRDASEGGQVPQNDAAQPAGGTSGAGMSGTASGPSTTGPFEGNRGSVPPGKDRAGDHPSSGAIVDPTGAATDTPIRH